METPPAHFSWPLAISHACEYASAVFGICGTFFMSRRIVPKFWRGMLFSLSYPLMVLFFQGHRVREYFVSRAALSSDVKDSLPDLTLGMNLLFWGFFLQLLSLLLK
jgi:hypothetical protein